MCVCVHLCVRVCVNECVCMHACNVYRLCMFLLGAYGRSGNHSAQASDFTALVDFSGYGNSFYTAQNTGICMHPLQKLVKRSVTKMQLHLCYKHLPRRWGSSLSVPLVTPSRSPPFPGRQTLCSQSVLRPAL